MMMMTMIWSVGVNNESRQWRQEDRGDRYRFAITCFPPVVLQLPDNSFQTTTVDSTSPELSCEIPETPKRKSTKSWSTLPFTLLSSAQGVPLSTHRFFCASFNFHSFNIPCHVTKLKDILRVSVHTQTTVWKISTYGQMGRVKIQIQIEEKRAKLPGMMAMIMKTVLTKKTQLIWPLLLTTMIKGRKLAAFRPSC